MGTQFFWFYDIVLVAIVLALIFKCFKKGFISTVLGFAAVVAGFSTALYFTEPVSDYIYSHYIENNVKEYIHTELESIVGANAFAGLAKVKTENIKVNGEYIIDIDAVPDPAGKVNLNLSELDLSQTGIDKLDLSFFGINSETFDFKNVNIGKININASDLLTNELEDVVLAKTLTSILQSSTNYGVLLSLNDAVSKIFPQFGNTNDHDFVSGVIIAIMKTDIDDAENALISGFIKPMVMLPVRAVVFFVVFTVVSLILSLLKKVFAFVNKVPVIGAINSLFGGIVGFGEAVIIVFLICIILHIIISITGNTIIFLNNMTINETFIFKHIYYIDFLNFNY